MTRTLAELNTRKASETPYTFELLIDGQKTGVMLDVVGQQSETFTNKATAIAKEYELAKGLESDNPAAFLISERTKLMTNKLVASRLIGWAGIKEEFSDDVALELVSSNQDAFTQILEASNKIGNFIKL